MYYTLYNNNGEIVKLLYLENPDDLELNTSDLNVYYGSSNPITQYVDNDSLIDKPENPYEYGIFNYETKQWEFDNQKAAENIIAERNQLLINSDWTDTYSASTRLSNYAEWQTYRQALRDIPQQETFPMSVIWPVAPS